MKWKKNNWNYIQQAIENGKKKTKNELGGKKLKQKTFKTERRQNNLTAHINLAHMLIHQRWRFRGPISRTKSPERSTSVGGLGGNRNSLRVIKGQQVHKIHFFKVIYYTENYTKPAEDSLICERIPRCRRSHTKKIHSVFLTTAGWNPSMSLVRLNACRVCGNCFKPNRSDQITSQQGERKKTTKL